MNLPRFTLPLILLATILGLGTWFLGQRESHIGHAHGPGDAQSEAPAARTGGKSITDTGIVWPSADDFHRTFTLRDYNTRVIFAGVSVLGAAGGLVGTFLLLRKRSLLSDTVSHCTMPGIALAFIVAEAAGFSGRSLPVLLTGAAVTGVLGMLAVATIRAHTKIKDDAALALVLSVFFGLGIALMVVVQQLPSGNVAGLPHFIYGKAASMTGSDARFILYASLAVAVACGALFKEFKLLCFDHDFARTQGWPVVALDLTLMGLVVAVTVIGLQAVGLLLVVALLIIPSAAARFWSHRLGVTMLVAAAIGASSGLVGVALSALFPKLPAGAVIVLATTTCFAFSFVFGAKRGLLRRWLDERAVTRRVRRQHLLRAVYEWCETAATPDQRGPGLLDRPVVSAELQGANRWSPGYFGALLRLGLAEGLLAAGASPREFRLSPLGMIEARKVTRNHRLWETYLLQYAAVAPQHIHHNADQIEHVVEPAIVNELEELLADRYGGVSVPANLEPRSSPADADPAL
jgi:manganese/zinc/iron transport system permease protein